MFLRCFGIVPSAKAADGNSHATTNTTATTASSASMPNKPTPTSLTSIPAPVLGAFVWDHLRPQAQAHLRATCKDLRTAADTLLPSSLHAELNVCTALHKYAPAKHSQVAGARHGAVHHAHAAASTEPGSFPALCSLLARSNGRITALNLTLHASSTFGEHHQNHHHNSSGSKLLHPFSKASANPTDLAIAVLEALGHAAPGLKHLKLHVQAHAPSTAAAGDSHHHYGHHNGSHADGAFALHPDILLAVCRCWPKLQVLGLRAEQVDDDPFAWASALEVLPRSLSALELNLQHGSHALLHELQAASHIAGSLRSLKVHGDSHTPFEAAWLRPLMPPTTVADVPAAGAASMVVQRQGVDSTIAVTAVVRTATYAAAAAAVPGLALDLGSCVGEVGKLLTAAGPHLTALSTSDLTLEQPLEEVLQGLPHLRDLTLAPCDNFRITRQSADAFAAEMNRLDRLSCGVYVLTQLRDVLDFPRGALRNLKQVEFRHSMWVHYLADVLPMLSPSCQVVLSGDASDELDVHVSARLEDTLSAISAVTSHPGGVWINVWGQLQRMCRLGYGFVGLLENSLGSAEVRDTLGRLFSSMHGLALSFKLWRVLTHFHKCLPLTTSSAGTHSAHSTHGRAANASEPPVDGFPSDTHGSPQRALTAGGASEPAGTTHWGVPNTVGGVEMGPGGGGVAGSGAGRMQCQAQAAPVQQSAAAWLQHALSGLETLTLPHVWPHDLQELGDLFLAGWFAGVRVVVVSSGSPGAMCPESLHALSARVEAHRGAGSLRVLVQKAHA